MTRRIMVVGCGGAGKSTVSRALSAHYALPLVHLDHHFWRPGWNRLSDEDWEATVTDLITAEAWIHDGNYNTTMPLRLARAELVVFVDMPRRVCLWRAFKRRIKREQVIPGCPERMNLDFLRYIWGFPQAGRLRTLRNLAEHASHAEVVRLCSRAQVRRYLASLAVSA